MGALPIIAGGAALAGGLFGRNKGGSSGSSSSASGFAAAPKELQQAYLKQYLPDILKQYEGKFNPGPLGQAPTGKFASRGLQDLQNYSNLQGGLFAGGNGVNPLGVVEPLNEYQENALGSLGGGINSLQSELGQYMNPYQQFVTDETNRQAGIGQNNLKNQFTQQAGLGGLTSSAFGSALSGNEENRLRLQNENQYNNYAQALGLRRQTLQDMLGAGTTIQQQNQNVLNAINPSVQATTPHGRSELLAEQLGRFPQSSTSSQVGPTEARPNFLSKLGGVGTAALGLGQSLGWPGFGGANAMGGLGSNGGGVPFSSLGGPQNLGGGMFRASGPSGPTNYRYA